MRKWNSKLRRRISELQFSSNKTINICSIKIFDYLYTLNVPKNFQMNFLCRLNSPLCDYHCWVDWPILSSIGLMENNIKPRVLRLKQIHLGLWHLDKWRKDQILWNRKIPAKSCRHLPNRIKKDCSSFCGLHILAVKRQFFKQLSQCVQLISGTSQVIVIIIIAQKKFWVEQRQQKESDCGF